MILKKPLLKNVFLYGVIGCFSACVDAGIFFTLTSIASLNPLIVNFISVPAGILVSFTLNRRFNFKVVDHPVKRGAIFFGVGLIGLVISQLIIIIGTSMGASVAVAKVLSILIVAAVQFTLNKLISFGLKM